MARKKTTGAGTKKSAPKPNQGEQVESDTVVETSSTAQNSAGRIDNPDDGALTGTETVAADKTPDADTSLTETTTSSDGSDPSSSDINAKESEKPRSEAAGNPRDTVDEANDAGLIETDVTTGEVGLVDETSESHDDTRGVDKPASEDSPIEQDEEKSDIIESVTQKTPEPVSQATSPASLVFGGVVAGAIGFAAAYFGLAQQTDPALDTLSSELEVLRGDLADLSSAPATEIDIGPLLTQIEDLSTRLDTVDAQAAETQTLIEEVRVQISGIEATAVSGTLSESAQESFAAELKAAQEAIAAERAALAEMMANAQAAEVEANEAALTATRRSALGEILTALDTGASFEDPLARLAVSGLEVPEVLQSVSTTGIVPMTLLQQQFPTAAREALSLTRAETEGTSGFSGFVRAQLGVRSLTPREGNDPDAVLSRAEAALSEANLAAALAELETLPPEALSVLNAWITDATQRRDVLLAAQGLSDRLN